MIKSLSLQQIAMPLKGRLHNDNVSVSREPFNRVSTDTRAIEPGDLFVALKGERFDAHQFLQQAREAGAVAMVVEQVDNTLACPQLQVSDTTRALGTLAQINREAFTGPLLALTGSCGKTTVKEMLVAVLAQAGRVHATRGNLNNHIGVPQTLLAMDADAEFVVIEMGASGPGEIDYLAGLAQPTVALVNNVMAAHLQGFGSKAGVAVEKTAIYRHLCQGGTAVINADEPYADDWQRALIKDRSDLRVLRFSLKDRAADVSASNIVLNTRGCYGFTVHAGGDSAVFELPLMGRQNVANTLAVTACCLAVGLSLDVVASGLMRVKPVAGRMQPISTASGAVVIDDSYNANPGSVRAAAAVLVDLQCSGQASILVLGDLAELGDDADDTLEVLGRELQQFGVRQLLTVGNNSERVLQSFSAQLDAGQSGQHFMTQDDVITFLKNTLTDNTVVLVKGSRSARMETVVQAITLGGEQ